MPENKACSKCGRNEGRRVGGVCELCFRAASPREREELSDIDDAEFNASLAKSAQTLKISSNRSPRGRGKETEK